MGYNIHQACEHGVNAAAAMLKTQEFVTIYCNEIAQRLTKIDNFEFDEMPETIIDVVFYGGEKPKEGWKTFITEEVKNELIRCRMIDA